MGKSKQNYSVQKNSGNKNIKKEVLLQIPGCIVHLIDEGQVLELAKGQFKLVQILDQRIPIATVIKVGNDLQWPLTKDEPVVKLDSVHYLFSLPMKGSGTLSYGLTFIEQYSSLSLLDSFLKEHSCFSCTNTSPNNKNLEWNQFTSKIVDYNNVLARAIAAGTGQIVRGIFMCSNAYSNQIHNGVEMISNQSMEEKSCAPVRRSNSISIGRTNSISVGRTNSISKNVVIAGESGTNESLKRVRNLSKMTENLSKTVLVGFGLATGSTIAPLVKSQTGQAFLATVPGEVVLASLDAINIIMEAAEVAAKQALSATSGAATKMVTNQFGENAGEATKDMLETAGHCASTAWNISKIRKAINPASSVSTGIAMNSRK